MAENHPDNKELRHQRAKNKHEHYQRVLSCKNLLQVNFISYAEQDFVLSISWPVSSHHFLVSQDQDHEIECDPDKGYQEDPERPFCISDGRGHA